MEKSIQVASETRVNMISSVVNLCSKATIELSTTSTKNAVIAIMIHGLKFINHDELYKTCLGHLFIDTEYISSRRGLNAKNILGDTSVWIELMKFVSFGHPQLTDSMLALEYPLLYNLMAPISTARMFDDNGGTAQTPKLTYDDLCKLFFLCNLEVRKNPSLEKSHTGVSVGLESRRDMPTRHDMSAPSVGLRCELYLIRVSQDIPCKHVTVPNPGVSGYSVQACYGT